MRLLRRRRSLANERDVDHREFEDADQAPLATRIARVNCRQALLPCSAQFLVARRGGKDRGDVRREGARDLEAEALRLAPPQRDLGLQQQRARRPCRRESASESRSSGTPALSSRAAPGPESSIAHWRCETSTSACGRPASAASSAPPSSGASSSAISSHSSGPSHSAARAPSRGRAQRLERRRRAEGGGDRQADLGAAAQDPARGERARRSP